MSKFAFRLLPNSKICCLSASKSAVFCGGGFLGVCLFFSGLMLISVRTASWSLTPGMTLQTLTIFCDDKVKGIVSSCWCSYQLD